MFHCLVHRCKESVFLGLLFGYDCCIRQRHVRYLCFTNPGSDYDFWMRTGNTAVSLVSWIFCSKTVFLPEPFRTVPKQSDPANWASTYDAEHANHESVKISLIFIGKSSENRSKKMIHRTKSFGMNVHRLTLYDFLMLPCVKIR